jgi:hypothetical protein
MKIGIKIKIDVTKIDRSQIYIGKKGKYVTMTSFVEIGEPDQYGNHGFVTVEKPRDADRDVRMPILGNVQIFWREQEQASGYPTQQYQQNQNQPKSQPQKNSAPDYDEIPF